MSPRELPGWIRMWPWFLSHSDVILLFDRRVQRSVWESWRECQHFSIDLGVYLCNPEHMYWQSAGSNLYIILSLSVSLYQIDIFRYNRYNYISRKAEEPFNMWSCCDAVLTSCVICFIGTLKKPLSVSFCYVWCQILCSGWAAIIIYLNLSRPAPEGIQLGEGNRF